MHAPIGWVVSGDVVAAPTVPARVTVLHSVNIPYSLLGLYLSDGIKIAHELTPLQAWAWVALLEPGP